MVKEKEAVVFQCSGKWIAYSHTLFAGLAFVGALIVGCCLHYTKIVTNEFYTYPTEWLDSTIKPKANLERFPSVSAAIGDRYPERSLFQIFIAITSGPRFALVFCWYLLTGQPRLFLPKFIACVGLLRTIFCGGWVYVTSTDDHQWHDIFMIGYLILTLPWTIGVLFTSPNHRRAMKWRKLFAGLFFGSLIPLVYFFIQHKVHRVPGAYTIYAFFEWSLIAYDVAFDAVTALDFETFELRILDVQGSSKGLNLYIKPNRELLSSNARYIESSTRMVTYAAAADFAADVYLSVSGCPTCDLWGSSFSGMALLNEDFPLWHMGISGYEATLMSTISPFILGIPSVRKFAAENIAGLQLLALSGVASYAVAGPANRLLTVAFAVSLSSIALASTLFNCASNLNLTEMKTSSFGIGLILSSIAKMAFWTNNPIWPIMHAENGGWNKLGLAFGVLACVRLYQTRKMSAISNTAVASPEESSLLAASGFGGLLFALHSLLSDSSTIILWVWDGYPVTGPLAVPHGAVTVTFMCVGLFVGITKKEVVGSWQWYAVGAVGAFFLTVFHGWVGYYGGLALTLHLMSIIPVFVGAAARLPPGRTFGGGFLIYNLLTLAHVWVVAYAFVPGGPLLRERTDLVMLGTMLLIAAGYRNINRPSQQSKLPRATDVEKRRRSSLSTVVLSICALLAIGIAYVRFPPYAYTPYHPDGHLLTAGIWTVHFGIDNGLWASEYRIRDLIRELELDVIGLLESDLQRIIMGNRDMTQFLAEDLGMYVDYGPGPNKHTWGVALLSKFPIINSTHHLLPSPVGELAPAIHATLEVYGKLVDVVVFHSGQEEDPEDRRLQSLEISRFMGSSPRPLILLSYLVTKPLEGNYNTYVSEATGMHDIDPTDWDRWCEYILYKGLRRVGYARVSRDTITDTEVQVGKFVVTETVSSNDLIEEAQVPENLRFPSLFRGNGVRGHRYHVFDEPR